MQCSAYGQLPTLLGGLMKKVLISFALLMGSVFAQQSQPATPTQQTATHVDSCTPVNGNAAAAAQATLTIQAPPSGQYIYITEIDLEIATTAAPTAAAEIVTSTNLNSTQWMLGLTTTVGNVFTLSMSYPTTMKSTTPATKVTIVGPTGATGMQQNFNACYYYGY
jgi:hypothetical protein